MRNSSRAATPPPRAFAKTAHGRFRRSRAPNPSKSEDEHYERTGGCEGMKLTLTGATGFVGSHVLTELQDHGHEVTALVRDQAQADRVAARGATPVVVDLYDRPTVVGLLTGADGAIHTASPGDETSA